MTAGLRGPERVTDPPTLDAIYRLRVDVWRETGISSASAFPDGRWCDAPDADSIHWGVHHDGELVAAMRLSMHERLTDVPDVEEYLAVGLRLEGPIALPRGWWSLLARAAMGSARSYATPGCRRRVPLSARSPCARRRPTDDGSCGAAAGTRRARPLPTSAFPAWSS